MLDRKFLIFESPDIANISYNRKTIPSRFVMCGKCCRYVLSLLA